MLLIEAVCQSAEDCRNVQTAGADRIEFVSAIELGGLTPSVEAVRQACRFSSIPIVVMVRPRSGGLHYSQLETDLLLAESEFWLKRTELPVVGIVTGALNPDSTLAITILKQIADMKNGQELVCHRCFDLTPDPFEAMEQLIDLGFSRILTSGQNSTAEHGVELLRELKEKAEGRIEIMPGGGIRAENAAIILSNSGCNQVHLGPFRSIESVSRDIMRGIDYGGHLVADSEQIRYLREALKD